MFKILSRFNFFFEFSNIQALHFAILQFLVRSLNSKCTFYFQVILIDWNKDSVALAMENTLLLKKWEGDTSDTSLIGLAQLLHSNAITKLFYFLHRLFIFYYIFRH